MGRTYTSVTFFCVIGSLAWCQDAPKQSKPDDPSHIVVRVSENEPMRACEVAIAIDPSNCNRLIAACQMARRGREPGSSAAYFSDNGGHTWTERKLPKLAQRADGDDVVAFANDGTAYRACISFSGLRQPRPQRASTGIFVSSSKDGLDWGQPVTVVDHMNSVAPFEDKPCLTVDTNTDSPHKGNLYVGWTRFEIYGSKDPAHKSHIFFSRSKDAGKTFSPMLQVSDRPGDCQDSSDTVMGASIAAGVQGEVLIAWSSTEGIVFDSSTDGGATFGTDTIISKTPGGWDIPAEGLARHNGLPILGVDRSNGPNRGTIYASWIDKRNGDPDVFLSASRDGGKKWTDPVRVNDDAVGNGKDQLFVGMAIDPADGSVNLSFLDRRDLTDTTTGVILARSIDGGRTFVNHRINQEPFACHKDVFLGDYNGIAAANGRVVAAYSHFVGRRDVAISAAIFQFTPGTQQCKAPAMPAR